jgi:hypothetical protein
MTEIKKNYSNSLDFSIENFTMSLENDADSEPMSGYEIVMAALRVQSIVAWVKGIASLGKWFGVQFGIKQILLGLVGTGFSLAWFTALSSIISCGTFDDGTDILKSPKCLNKINEFKLKHKKCPTLNMIKNNPDVRSKSGFLKFIFLDQASGKKINALEPHNVAIREINGVPVSIVQLEPFAGSVDLRQLSGLRIIIVTGYYLSGNKIMSKNLCQGYIVKGAQVNKSGEELFNFIGY